MTALSWTDGDPQGLVLHLSEDGAAQVSQASPALGCPYLWVVLAQAASVSETPGDPAVTTYRISVPTGRGRRPIVYLFRSPGGEDLAQELARWPGATAEPLDACEPAVEGWVS